MPVSYNKKLRDEAKEKGLCLITIDAGIRYQGLATEDERMELARLFLDFLKRQREAEKNRDQ